MGHPAVAVVIPARNEAANLPRVLNALQQAVEAYPGPCELFLVDNGSRDDTVAIARSFGCRVVEEPHGSIARLRNRGAACSASEMVAFLDADCLVDRTWLCSCIAILADKRIGLTGTPAVPDLAHATWVELAWYRLATGVRRPDFPNWIGSSNMLMPRQLFNAIGGFDEHLTTAEDVNFCHKIRQTRLVCLNKAVVTIHLRESKTLGNLLRRELWRGQGSIRQLWESTRKRDDALSVIVPSFQLSCCCCAALSAPFHPPFAGLLFAVVALLPLAMMLKKKALCSGFSASLQIYLVAFVFLLARSLAIAAELFTIITTARKGGQHA